MLILLFLTLLYCLEVVQKSSFEPFPSDFALRERWVNFDGDDDDNDNDDNDDE